MFKRIYGNGRGIVIAIAIAAVMLAVCGCGSSGQDNIEASVSETAEAADYSDLSKYRIVRRDTARDDETKISINLRNRLNEYGIELTLATDWTDGTEEHAETECEILVGRTNRAESNAFAEKVKACAAEDTDAESLCAYGMTGSKILLYASDNEGLELIAQCFAEEVGKAGNRSFLHDGDMAIFTINTGLHRKDGEELKKQDRLYGVNIHSKIYPGYPGEYTDEYIRLAAEMGSTILRINYNPTNAGELEYITGVADKCHEHGMKIMLCMDNFGGTVEEIEKRMTFAAENLADKVDYFQIFNETDIWCCMKDDGVTYYNPTDWTGMTRSYYNPKRVPVAVERVGAAVKAFRAAAPDAKIVLNVGSRHYPMLDRYVEAGISWDIIGFDIYEIDLWDHAEFFKKMEERYPGYDFMITECNYPANNGAFTDEAQAQWLTDFFDIMAAYDSERMKAVIIYEMMDQPNIEKDGNYNGEAHFGIVHINEDMSPADPKPSYYAVQKWIVGGEAEYGASLSEVR